MKTRKFAASVLSIFIFLIASVSMNAFASSQNNERSFSHKTMASHYQNLAREMLAKAEAKSEALKNKPRTSFFGKNGQKIKSNVAHKIFNYKKTAAEYLQKAAYHQKIAAEQQERRSVAKPNQTNEQINKAKEEFGNNKETL